jgi:hypothetical protein
MKKYRVFLLTANDYFNIFSFMANQRLSIERRALILSALGEGTPVNAVCRMFKVGKNSVLRIIAETGEAFADYMDRYPGRGRWRGGPSMDAGKGGYRDD